MKSTYQHATHAKVAELVDALVLGASGETRESSSLSFRTILPGTLNGIQQVKFRSATVCSSRKI